jgi:PAS domain S-box-containing protein
MYDQRVLQKIVEGTAVETGEAFFDELVKRLAQAMNTKFAWVTEWFERENRLKSISFWAGDDFYGDYEYDVSGTPCEPVIVNRKFFCVPDRVFELFPNDSDLSKHGTVSYMGIPLFDTDGGILGHLALLDTKPMPDDPTLEGIFKIFAARASAELRRICRDRALREREEKLSRLFNSTMDGIVELDQTLRITQVNKAAMTLFRCSETDLIGSPFSRYTSEAEHGKLLYLARDLDRAPSGKQSLWIRDGFEAQRTDGETFAVEATLSRFEVKGDSFYTLILRDINERLAAEQQIKSLLDETAYLRVEINALQGFDQIVGKSAALQQVLADVSQVASSEATVLITGETGTGKELIARAIHQRSARAEGPLIKVNCAAIATNLQESEFFGHEKGAFTGATETRPGRFKLAHGGTIFLDEVGELPLDLQAKLLRVLQEGEYEPVGSAETVKVDVRVISATHRDLEIMVKAGTFRMDLLYRLNVFPLHLPPLRDREEDIILLSQIFVKNIAQRNGRILPRLTEDDKVKLRRYTWPGNIRELQNVLERAIITSPQPHRLNLARALPDTGSIEAMAPGDSVAVTDDHILTVTEMRDLERKNIIRALEQADWKISGANGAAECLGLNPNTLSSRMKTLGIQRS